MDKGYVTISLEEYDRLRGLEAENKELKEEIKSLEYWGNEVCKEIGIKKGLNPNLEFYENNYFKPDIMDCTIEHYEKIKKEKENG